MTSSRSDHVPLIPRRDTQLEAVVNASREAVIGGQDWDSIAARVVAVLRDCQLTPSLLSSDQRIGSPERITSHCLHVEPNGGFSLVALVCRPSQSTRIHDHVTWCVFAVLAGSPVEELFALDEAENILIPAGQESCPTGSVRGGAPPGDIHRLGNPGSETAISLHVYGTDVSRIESSARRIYDLPVRHAEIGARK
jgi:3-mercaptopropionate dioxygenase